MQKLTKKQVISELTNLNVSLELAINAIESFSSMVETIDDDTEMISDDTEMISDDNGLIRALIDKSITFRSKVKSLLS